MTPRGPVEGIGRQTAVRGAPLHCRCRSGPGEGGERRGEGEKEEGGRSGGVGGEGRKKEGRRKEEGRGNEGEMKGCEDGGSGGEGTESVSARERGSQRKGETMRGSGITYATPCHPHPAAASHAGQASRCWLTVTSICDKSAPSVEQLLS